MPHGKTNKFPLQKTLKTLKLRSHYSNKNSEFFQGKDVGNGEINLRQKNLFSWQNILNNRQIIADIEQKLTDQVVFPQERISGIHTKKPSTVGHVISNSTVTNDLK